MKKLFTIILIAVCFGLAGQIRIGDFKKIHLRDKMYNGNYDLIYPFVDSIGQWHYTYMRDPTEPLDGVNLRSMRWALTNLFDTLVIGIDTFLTLPPDTFYNTYTETWLYSGASIIFPEQTDTFYNDYTDLWIGNGDAIYFPPADTIYNYWDGAWLGINDTIYFPPADTMFLEWASIWLGISDTILSDTSLIYWEEAYCNDCWRFKYVGDDEWYDSICSENFTSNLLVTYRSDRVVRVMDGAVWGDTDEALTDGDYIGFIDSTDFETNGDFSKYKALVKFNADTGYIWQGNFLLNSDYTIIGANAGASSISNGEALYPTLKQDNVVLIGHNAQPTLDNQVVLGDSTIDQVWSHAHYTGTGYMILQDTLYLNHLILNPADSGKYAMHMRDSVEWMEILSDSFLYFNAWIQGGDTISITQFIDSLFYNDVWLTNLDTIFSGSLRDSFYFDGEWHHSGDTIFDGSLSDTMFFYDGNWYGLGDTIFATTFLDSFYFEGEWHWSGDTIFEGSLADTMIFYNGDWYGLGDTINILDQGDSIFVLPDLFWYGLGDTLNIYWDSLNGGLYYADNIGIGVEPSAIGKLYVYQSSTNAAIQVSQYGAGNLINATSESGTVFYVDTSGVMYSSGLTYPGEDGTIGQIMGTDGSGTISFTDDKKLSIWHTTGRYSTPGYLSPDFFDSTVYYDKTLYYPIDLDSFYYENGDEWVGNYDTLTVANIDSFYYDGIWYSGGDTLMIAGVDSFYFNGEWYGANDSLVVDINATSDIDTTGIEDGKILIWDSGSGTWVVGKLQIQHYLTTADVWYDLSNIVTIEAVTPQTAGLMTAEMYQLFDSFEDSLKSVSIEADTLYSGIIYVDTIYSYSTDTVYIPSLRVDTIFVANEPINLESDSLYFTHDSTWYRNGDTVETGWTEDAYGINYQEGNVGIGIASSEANAKLDVYSNSYMAIYGESSVDNGIMGVSDANTGVMGISASGPGVSGYSDTGTGVSGYSESGYSGEFAGGLGVNIKAGGLLINDVSSIDGDGFFHPVSSADADAPNNSVYYSTTSSKLVYKDPSGNVNALY